MKKKKVRSYAGTMIYPTSTNSEDAKIPKNGVVSRIYAKNLVLFDEFCLTGGLTGTVTRTKYTRKTEKVLVEITRPDGKTFERNLDFYDRVSIIEYPGSRFYRRFLSRLPANVRYG